MDSNMRDVPESMKLVRPTNYIIWSYKVKLLLMQEGLWRFVEPAASDSHPKITRSSSNTVSARREAVTVPRHVPDTGLPPMTPNITVPDHTNATDINNNRETKLRYRAGRLIISMVRDSIILSVIHLTDPKDIWQWLRHMCDVRSSS